VRHLGLRDNRDDDLSANLDNRSEAAAMSRAPQVRRTDKIMPEQRIQEMIATGYYGRLASVGPDGWPYVVPMLYVWVNGEVWLHNTGAHGHLRTNVTHEHRVCFELDEPGQVFAYGRFECDTSIAYRSVVIFGLIRIVESQSDKQVFFELLMQKYGKPEWGRPGSFFPRIDQVTVYAITIERATGKETLLPAIEERWPLADKTKTPDVSGR
jgi:nitroimidazol reductase NimA-like FMN-containing flavoprotein (pyridoxamine 5'-phosphate oxidase superfamily)